MLKNFLNKHWDAGILFIRIGVGISFGFVYGLMKIQGGIELWKQIGASMGNIGITFSPVFWGFLASASEFFGGILMLLGLFTRIAASFLAFTMLMAFAHHIKAMDSWAFAMHPNGTVCCFYGNDISWRR
jgi:putative oxidoreductase